MHRLASLAPIPFLLVGCIIATPDTKTTATPRQPEGPAVTPPPHQPEPRNLIANGSFEAPALAQGSWQVLGTIPGWAATGPGIEVQRHVAGEPADGDQHIELDSDASTNVYQDVTTRPGARYQLSYQYSPRPGTSIEDNRLEIWWNGMRVDAVEGQLADATRWQTRTVEVSAPGEVARLELRDGGPSNGVGAYVDDVALVEITSTVVVAK